MKRRAIIAAHVAPNVYNSGAQSPWLGINPTSQSLVIAGGGSGGSPPNRANIAYDGEDEPIGPLLILTIVQISDQTFSQRSLGVARAVLSLDLRVQRIFDGIGELIVILQLDARRRSAAKDLVLELNENLRSHGLLVVSAGCYICGRPDLGQFQILDAPPSSISLSEIANPTPCIRRCQNRSAKINNHKHYLRITRPYREDRQPHKLRRIDRTSSKGKNAGITCPKLGNHCDTLQPPTKREVNNGR